MSSAPAGRLGSRNIGVGLPSSPRPRSVGRYDRRVKEETESEQNRGRGREHYPYHDTPGVRSRSAHTHGSAASLAHSGVGPSSYKDVPDHVPPLPRPRQRHWDARTQSSTSTGSSSSSSALSTFLDRMNARGGYASSRTSFEEEPEPRKNLRNERGGGLHHQTTTALEPETGDIEEEEQGYGMALWSRVAKAANSLTISVSKAWTNNIAMYSGERTPPGEESRLTRAMKAYHIQKARDPTDLPPWLFDEHERRPLGLSSTSGRYREHSGYGEHETSEAVASPRRRNLRDDTAATPPSFSSPQEMRRLPGVQPDDVSASPPSSKPIDRLKALRDAKRSAEAQRSVPVRDAYGDSNGSGGPLPVERGRRYSPDRGPGVGAHANRAPSPPASVRPKVGLPPRPAMRKR